MAETKIADQVRLLMDAWGHRSLRAAAEHVGVPFATIQRALEGRTPRHDGLLKIARGYAVTVDWLLTGSGTGPRVGDVAAVDRDADRWAGAAIDWDSLVLSLDLPEPAHTALIDLPVTTAVATVTLFLPALATGEGHDYPRATDALRESSRLEHQAWITWLQECITLFGREVVRQTVIENADRFRLRFAPHEHIPARTNAEIRKSSKASRTRRRKN